MKVHHIGYAVKDIEKAILDFEFLGYNFNKIVYDELRGIKIVFGYNKPYCVELISPLTEKNPINKILKVSGAQPYHICYEVSNLEYEINNLRKNKWIVVQKSTIAIAIENRNVVFLYNKNIGLIELVEK